MRNATILHNRFVVTEEESLAKYRYSKVSEHQSDIDDLLNCKFGSDKLRTIRINVLSSYRMESWQT